MVPSEIVTPRSAAAQLDLWPVIDIPVLRCERCEGYLGPRPEDEHPEPALMCINPACERGGYCMTCARLVAWFQHQNEVLDR